jgi:protein-disulfide isomerase
MQSQSQGKEPAVKPAVSRNQIMNDIAKGAFVVLCLAGAYKLMFSTDTQPVALSAPIVAQMQSTPLPIAPAATTEKAPSENKALDQSDKQKLGELIKARESLKAPSENIALDQIDEQKLGELIKARESQVAAQEKVTFSVGKPAVQAPPASAVHPTPAAPQAPQSLPLAEQGAPTAAVASRQAPPGTVAKVGYMNDGSPMTESQKRAQITDALAKIPDEFTVQWKAPQEKASIYVFTDPTCPYCQKLHRAIPELNAAGITVHYLMYPRDMARLNGGPGESVTQMNLDNVWCSADQKAAMSDAYAGYKVPAADCAALPAELKRIPSPIAQQYFLGNVFGVNGTPSVFTADGKDLPGFQSAQKLISEVLN